VRSTALLLLVLSGFAAAASNPATRQEIDALLAALGGSQCRFERNGTWYDAAAAVEHLRKKRDYLEDKGKIARTEDFIRLGASESSMSGKPYHVRCPDQPATTSRAWLEARLATLRSSAR